MPVDELPIAFKEEPGGEREVAEDKEHERRGVEVRALVEIDHLLGPFRTEHPFQSSIDFSLFLCDQGQRCDRYVSVFVSVAAFCGKSYR